MASSPKSVEALIRQVCRVRAQLLKEGTDMHVAFTFTPVSKKKRRKGKGEQRG